MSRWKHKHPRLVVALVPFAASCASPAAPQPADKSPVAIIVPAAPEPVASASSAPPPADPPPPPPGPVAPRVYAKTRFVWVHYEPSAGSGWLGYLWMGGSAELKDPKPIPGNGGCNAWYAVKPKGFVCGDGGGATVDPSDPVLVAMKPYVPDLSSPWPHHYGESRGAERYFSSPTAEDQRGREWELEAHRKHMEAAASGTIDPELLGVDLALADATPLVLPDLPSTVRERRRRMTPLSTVAWSRDLEAAGRNFLLTADYAYVPKDRVAPYPISKFHGVELGKDTVLPIAFFRERARPKIRLGDDGLATPTGESWERHAYVGLTGQSRQVGDVRYLETKESGIWVLAADATVVKSQERTPWGAPVGGEDTSKASGRRSWLETSIMGGWLIAYEGTTPVYATLISPGRGGLPRPDVDPLVTASTPMGTWPISGKFATATMVAPGEFVHSDVPWTQNFHGPHALHGAYWHDAWGEKKSAGCVNVSPIDGKWLYEFTDPKVPEGWHGIRFEPEMGPATTMVVHSLSRDMNRSGRRPPQSTKVQEHGAAPRALKNNWGPAAIVTASALSGGSSCGLGIFQFGAGVDGNGALFTQPWAQGMMAWALLWPLGVALGLALSPKSRVLVALGLLAWVPGFLGLLGTGAPKDWLLASVRDGCAKDDAPSCLRLADYYRHGRLVPKDEEAAVTNERKSCRLGFVYACVALVEADRERHFAEACPRIKEDCSGPHPSHFCARVLPGCTTAPP